MDLIEPRMDCLSETEDFFKNGGEVPESLGTPLCKGAADRYLSLGHLPQRYLIPTSEVPYYIKEKWTVWRSDGRAYFLAKILG